MNRVVEIGRVAGMLCLLVWAAGCVTPESAERKAAGGLEASLKSTRSASDAARTRITGTVDLLNELVVVPQEDLRPLHARVVSSTQAIKRDAQEAARAANVFRQDASRYRAVWDTTVEETDDEDMRALREASRDAVRAGLEAIELAAMAVREGYWPLIKNLDDIVSHLKLDLTGGGIEALREPSRQALLDAAELDARIVELVDRMDQLSTTMGFKP